MMIPAWLTGLLEGTALFASPWWPGPLFRDYAGWWMLCSAYPPGHLKNHGGEKAEKVRLEPEPVNFSPLGSAFV